VRKALAAPSSTPHIAVGRVGVGRHDGKVCGGGSITTVAGSDIGGSPGTWWPVLMIGGCFPPRHLSGDCDMVAIRSGGGGRLPACGVRFRCWVAASQPPLRRFDDECGVAARSRTGSRRVAARSGAGSLVPPSPYPSPCRWVYLQIRPCWAGTTHARVGLKPS
jgi:hypothetical protein